MTLSLKMEPELRHALAHILYAIDSLAKGVESIAKDAGLKPSADLAEAQYELDSIRGLVFWDSDAGQTADAAEWRRRQLESQEENHGEEVQHQDVQELHAEGRQVVGRGPVADAQGQGLEDLQEQEVGSPTHSEINRKRNETHLRNSVARLAETEKDRING